MPENSTHKCTNAVNNVQPIRNSSHMANILSMCKYASDLWVDELGMFIYLKDHASMKVTH